MHRGAQSKSWRSFARAFRELANGLGVRQSLALWAKRGKPALIGSAALELETFFPNLETFLPLRKQFPVAPVQISRKVMESALGTCCACIGGSRYAAMC
jgi:hypothetical protein